MPQNQVLVTTRIYQSVSKFRHARAYQNIKKELEIVIIDMKEIQDAIECKKNVSVNDKHIITININ